MQDKNAFFGLILPIFLQMCGVLNIRINKLTIYSKKHYTDKIYKR